MSNTLPNLDRLAAQCAQNIIRTTTDVENTVTKALGVLQENGVYACFLYLLAKEKSNSEKVVEEMLNLLEGLGFGWEKPTSSNDPEVVLQHITDKVTVNLEPVNLERLLLAKETLEQMLIYARYGAKAKARED
jgi:hypothetical protein